MSGIRSLTFLYLDHATSCIWIMPYLVSVDAMSGTNSIPCLVSGSCYAWCLKHAVCRTQQGQGSNGGSQHQGHSNIYGVFCFRDRPTIHSESTLVIYIKLYNDW